MNASGNVSLGSHMVSAGLPLAGQRVTLQLDGPVAHILSGGILARTIACPVPRDARTRLRGARAGTAQLPRLPEPVVVTRRVSVRAILVPAVAVCFLLQWGLARATGIKAGPRPLRVLRDGLFYYRPGRPAGIAIAVVSFAALATEHFLIDRGPLAAAIVVAALAVAAEVTAQQALLRAIRQDLRGGGGAA